MDDFTGCGYVFVDEVRLPNTPLVRPAPNFVEDLKRFQTKKDDVFITSYPKSGLLRGIWFYKQGKAHTYNQ